MESGNHRFQWHNSWLCLLAFGGLFHRQEIGSGEGIPRVDANTPGSSRWPTPYLEKLSNREALGPDNAWYTSVINMLTWRNWFLLQCRAIQQRCYRCKSTVSCTAYSVYILTRSRSVGTMVSSKLLSLLNYVDDILLAACEWHLAWSMLQVFPD